MSGKIVLYDRKNWKQGRENLLGDNFYAVLYREIFLKVRQNLLRENSGELKGIFRDKAPRKNYLRANFHGLAYNFYGHIRQFFRSYKIVSPLNRDNMTSLRSSSFC